MLAISAALALVIAVALALPRSTRHLAPYVLLVPWLALLGSVALGLSLLALFDRLFGSPGQLWAVYIGYPAGGMLGAITGFLLARKIGRSLGV